MKKWLFIVICILILSMGLSAQETEEADDLPWWNDRIFYEVFVRSFYDSDGDGIGDIQGLIEKLDYLNDGDPNTTTDLGVTGLWLMPIMQSPSYHGYDVVDYYTIEQDYGTNEDFQALMQAAHERDMVVIVDLVMNHTSTQHPWFEESSSDPDSEYADWYVWETERPNFSGPTGQRVWHQNGDRYYYALFWDQMPDLNFNNPDVTAAMYDIIDYWLTDMGADGFRLDAIKHLVENGSIQENTPQTHEWLQGFHDHVRSVNPDALAVGEAWTDTPKAVEYIGDEVDIVFEFDLAEAMLSSVRFGSAAFVTGAQGIVQEEYPQGQYAAFLTNHDQNRVMSLLRENLEAGKVAASLLLTNPGVPFIYYGEEIGMTGEKPDERIRTPMQWDASDTAGFTTGQPWEALQQNFRSFTVAAQDEAPDSLLNHYRMMVHTRNNSEALRTGDFTFVENDVRGVYSFLRSTGEETVLVAINLDDRPAESPAFTLAEGSLTGGNATLLVGEGEVSNAEINSAGGFDAYIPVESIPAYGTLIIKLGE